MTTEEFMDKFEGVSPPTEEQKRCLEAAMEEHKRLIKEAEIERREGPRRRFFAQGHAAGF